MSYPSTAQRVALDAIEQAFGVRLEAHQVLAMARTCRWWQMPHFSPGYLVRFDLRESDTKTWAEVLRMAYAGTQGRRRSRAARAGKACGKAAFPHGHHHGLGPAEDWPRRCHRWAGHEGRCES